MADPLPGPVGHLVDAGGGERLSYAGMELVIRASAASTGGALGIVEEIDAVDTPPHVHEREDELFYVLDGRHVFTVGDTEYEAGPGDLVFGPRGIPHAQRHLDDSGRTLTIFTPGGLEGFFRDLSEAEASGSMAFEDLGRIAATYGISLLNPDHGQ